MWISGSVRWNLFLRSLCNVLLYSSCFVGFFPLLLPFLKNAMHTCLVTKPCQTLGDLRAYSPPGSSAGGQREESGPWQGHAEGSLTKHKVVIRLQGFPLEFPEHPPPKTRVCLLYCVMLSTYSSVINRGLSPHHLFLEKVNLELLDNKSPGHNKSVSSKTPLMVF